MSRIADKAEDCNANPTAQATNAAFAESAPRGISTGSGDQPAKKHSFSRKLARAIEKAKRKKNPKAKHGANESLVLKYLAHRVRTSKNVIDGKKWFYITLDELVELFPYLGRTTIYEIVVRLKELAYLRIDNFNRFKYDDTFWYHVSAQVCNAVEEDLVYFDAAMAKVVGVPAAVVHYNFLYWIDEYKEQGRVLEVSMSPVTLSRFLPFSIDTIKRALKKLEGRFLKKVSENSPYYGIAEIPSGINGANPNRISAYPNENGAYPNEISAYPNDDTSYVTIGNLLETCSKGEPAALSFSNSFGDTNNTCDNGLVDPSQVINEGKADGHNEPFVRHDEIISPRGDLLISSTPNNNSPAPSVNTPATPASSPSTADISGAAENVKGEWQCPISSHRSLHANNRAVNELVESWPKDVRESFRDRVLEMARSFLIEQEMDAISDWNYVEEPEELFSNIAPAFTKFFRTTVRSISESDILYPTLFGGTLECVMGAFLWEKSPAGFYTHPTAVLDILVYKIRMTVWQMLEKLREREVKEEFAAMRREHASPDEAKEHDADISPAEKARVFRNAIDAKNNVGWIFFDQTHRTNQITNIKRALPLVQRLFEHNENMTVAELLKIMDGSMGAFINQPAPQKPQYYKGWYPPKGVMWHARMGRDLLFFMKNLHLIVEQLGMTSTCPIEMFLKDCKEEEHLAAA